MDVDGTLVGRDGTISPENREALARARQAGVLVSLSTGRVPKACLKIINQLSLDGYHIFFDGAQVSDPGQSLEVYALPLKKEVVEELVGFAHKHDIYVELYSATDYFIERGHWSLEIHEEFFGIEPTFVDFAGLWDREKIIKGELVVSSAEEIAKAELCQDHFKDRMRFSWAMTPAYPDVHFVNVLDPGVSKGKALEALASHLGVSMAEVVAIGDGVNDIPLLVEAGLAIAMANAPEEVKKVADFVTLDVDQSGLAAAVKKFL